MVLESQQRGIPKIFRTNDAKENVISGARKTEEKDDRLKKVCILQKLQQLVYPFFLFVLVVGVIVQSTKCLVVFIKAPTYTDVQSVPQMDAAFPAITFCPMKDGLNETVLKVHVLYNINTYISNPNRLRQYTLIQIVSFRNVTHIS